MSYELICAILGERNAITLKVDMTWTVGELQNAIKEETETTSAAHKLTLYRVNIDISDTKLIPRVMEQICESSFEFQREKLSPGYCLSDYWGASDLLRGKIIHIIVKMPRGESSDSRAYGAVAETHLPNNLHFIICPRLHCPSNDVPMPITAPLLQFCNH